MATDADIIKDAKEAFKQASDADSDWRTAALDDLEFARLAKQWPAEIEAQRKIERRACLTINRMPAFIRQVVNDARQNRPSIKTYPVGDGADQITAKIIDGLIRNIEVQSNADIAYDTAVDFAVSCGIGYFRVDVDYAHDDTFDMDLKISPIFNPFSVYGDPKGAGGDSADWNFALVTELMKSADFKRQYPKAKVASWEDKGEDDKGIGTDEVRVAEYWQRSESKRRIVLIRNAAESRVIPADQFEANRELFGLEGFVVAGDREVRSYDVKQYLLTGADVLSTVNWSGRYIPIIPVYGEELNVGGKKYFRSLIHDAKDAQRMFNFWRTASTELVALAPKAPFIGPKGAFSSDRAKWESANAKSHAYIEYDGPTPPQRQPFSGVPAGALQEALNASDDMKAIMGIYDPALGARSNETSGRAILARQRESDTATFHFIDNLSRSIRHAGRVLVDLIPSVYNSERSLRVLDDDGASSEVPIKQEVQTPQGPRVFDLGTGKYDVVVKAGPSYTTRREEARVEMANMLQAAGPAAPVFLAQIAKHSDWPGSDKIAQSLENMLPPAAKGEGPTPQEMQMKQALQQMQQALQAAQTEIGNLQGELKNKQAEHALKARELEIKAAESGATPRRKVIQIQAPSGQTYTGEVADA